MQCKKKGRGCCKQPSDVIRDILINMHVTAHRHICDAHQCLKHKWGKYKIQSQIDQMQNDSKSLVLSQGG